MKYEIEFPIVGSKYIEGGLLICQALNIGDILELVREPSNSDQNAIAVFSVGKKIGYVPNKGISCSKCWVHIGKEDFFCPKCGSDEFVMGGLATRLIGSGHIERKHACLVCEVDLGSSLPIKALLIVE